MRYPVMMQDVYSSLVVCFSSYCTGHVVVGNNSWDVGGYGYNWVSAENKDEWRPYVPPKPKKIVYEWHVTDRLRTEKDAENEFKSYKEYKKTGRSFEVEGD